jgi:hypothetical protein
MIRPLRQQFHSFGVQNKQTNEARLAAEKYSNCQKVNLLRLKSYFLATLVLRQSESESFFPIELLSKTFQISIVVLVKH